MAQKTVMILGAGMAGLCAAKRALERGFKVIVYEKGDGLGGLWHCKDDLDHVCMYEGLRSNQPRQIMQYPDYFFPQQDQWYFSAKEVHNYLINYAVEFGVDKVVQLQKEVTEIRPGDGKNWKVTVTDLQSKVKETREFDFVAICNGHFNQPRMVAVKGQELFKGDQIHSVKFRKAKQLQGKRVLVIGSGVSAMDISMLLTKECPAVYLSQRTSFALDFEKPDNLTFCPVAEKLTETGVVLQDGRCFEVDAIVYATGYQYSFPFLAPDCGITVSEDNHIRELYKHCLNVSHPTMAFIGIPVVVLAQEIIDLQSQFCMKVWSGEVELPGAEEMGKEIEADFQKREASGRNSHRLVKIAREYHNDLADTAGVSRTKNVLHNIADYFVPAVMNNYLKYRDECYEVLDDETFRTFWK